MAGVLQQRKSTKTAVFSWYGSHHRHFPTPTADFAAVSVAQPNQGVVTSAGTEIPIQNKHFFFSLTLPSKTSTLGTCAEWSFHAHTRTPSGLGGLACLSDALLSSGQVRNEPTNSVPRVWVRGPLDASSSRFGNVCLQRASGFGGGEVDDLISEQGDSGDTRICNMPREDESGMR